MSKKLSHWLQNELRTCNYKYLHTSETDQELGRWGGRNNWLCDQEEKTVCQEREEEEIGGGKKW